MCGVCNVGVRLCSIIGVKVLPTSRSSRNITGKVDYAFLTLLISPGPPIASN